MKWPSILLLLGYCQSMDIQNNPFLQHLKIRNSEDLAILYPNNPFFQALVTGGPLIDITAKSTGTSRPTTTTKEPTTVTSSDITLKSSDVCGRPLAVNELIFNGYKTNEGDWPWITAIFFKAKSNDTTSFICGGNLINKKFVISAAHCVARLDSLFGRDNYELFSYLGLFDLTRLDAPDVQKKKVDRMYVHPDYKYGEYSDSDISVLRLKTPVEYTQFVRPICLWKWKTDLNFVVGSTGRIVGWGRSEAKGGPTNEPNLVDMPIVSQKECRASHIAFHYFTSERTFCAGFRNNSGPCNGDSGSGMILRMKDNGKERWYLRGVVSQSLKKNFRCDLDEFFIFTDVPQFGPWLKSFTKDEYL